MTAASNRYIERRRKKKNYKDTDTHFLAFAFYFQIRFLCKYHLNSFPPHFCLFIVWPIEMRANAHTNRLSVLRLLHFFSSPLLLPRLVLRFMRQHLCSFPLHWLWFRVKSNLITFKEAFRFFFFSLSLFHSPFAVRNGKAYWLKIDWKWPSKMR